MNHAQSNLSFLEARERIVARASRVGSEQVPLTEARSRTLFESVVSPAPLPPFDASAMDGYALSSRDASSAGLFELTVEGESRAGVPLGMLAADKACRIFTGAVLPPGADAVVIQEKCERTEHGIRFEGPIHPFQNVRRAGSELQEGAVALEAGAVLTPFALSLLAALDMTEVNVSARPRVALIATGDELRAPGTKGPAGMLAESNTIALSGLCDRAGAQVTRVAHVGDNEDNTVKALADAINDSDLVVTIGGISVGDHDVVRTALSRVGVQLEFSKVRIKPGKPIAFGSAARTLILGLPGNPVSAQLTFCLFGMPLLRAMQGQPRIFPEERMAVLESALSHTPGRLGFYRVHLRGNRAFPDGNQSSGSAGSLAWADALAVVPEESGDLPAGSRVSVLRLADL